MNLKEIRELLELVGASGIEEFEMERSGFRIRIKKSSSPRVEAVTAQPLHHSASADAPVAEEKPAEKKEALYTFQAPIVGTFYLNPKPDAEPFVRPGDRVQKGSVLCIIEAMKLFNQIESDVDGEIVRLLVENGQPVEYGEPLFEIRLTA